MELILVELNELNFEYAKRYLKSHKLTSIEKINSTIQNTVSEKSYDLLEPWIQWSSVHTGCSAVDHNIYRLGDAIHSDKEQMFEQIEKKGFKVGVISAMNAVNRLKKPSYFIPDPWTRTPSDDSFFNKLITKVLRQTVSDNAKGSISFLNYIYLILIFFKFVRIKKYFFLFTIFLETFYKKWKKAIFLDSLIHEIHLNLLIKKKPNFSTVFFNAGAHIQHHYLLNSKVNNSGIKNPDYVVDPKYDPFGEVLIFYDQILEDYLSLDKDIIIATGLTQDIVKEPEYYYRLIDHENFCRKIKINFKEIQPRMSRDFLIVFLNNEDRDNGYTKLSKIKINNIKIFGVLDKREKSLFVTLTYNKLILKNDKAILDNLNFEFFNDVVFVALKNGYHSPNGYLYADGKIKKEFNINNMNVSEIKNKG